LCGAIAGQTLPEKTTTSRIHDWLDRYERKSGLLIPMHMVELPAVRESVLIRTKWISGCRGIQSIKRPRDHKYGLFPTGLAGSFSRTQGVQ